MSVSSVITGRGSTARNEDSTDGEKPPSRTHRAERLHTRPRVKCPVAGTESNTRRAEKPARMNAAEWSARRPGIE